MLAVQTMEGYVVGMIKIKIKPFRGFFMASADSHLNHLWFFPKNESEYQSFSSASVSI